MNFFRYLVRLSIAYLNRFKGLIIAGTILGILVFVFVNFLRPLIFGKSIEKIGITGRHHTDSLPIWIQELIGDGLTKVNENGNAEPNLAQSWESPDKGKTWIFRLKDGLFWQDGEKVTSDSVVYQFSEVEIERPDEKTIVFKLKEPFSPFPMAVSRPTFKKGLLGTGEWEVTKVSLGQGNFVQKLSLKNKSGDKKNINFYPTEERTKLAYKLGEVDILYELLDPKPYDSWSNNTQVLEDVDIDKVVVIFFNTKDKFLSDKSLRQSLIYGLSKELGGPRAISSISPNSWAYNPQVKKYSYDAERAKELFDDVPGELKENLSIGLVTTPALISIAEEISRQWKEIGINTFVQITAGIPQEFQAYLAIFDIPTDPDQYSIWHSTQTTTNISRYENPRIDKLLEDGRVELDLEERRKIYLDFQRFLIEDSPAVFLYHPASYTILRK